MILPIYTYGQPVLRKEAEDTARNLIAMGIVHPRGHC